MFESLIKLSDIELNENDSTWDTIRTLKAVIEKNPEDVKALSALADAYEHSGDNVCARDYRLRLAHILERDGEWRQILELANHLLKLRPDDQVALSLYGKARENVIGDQTVHMYPDKTKVHNPEEFDFDLNAELDLAWLLLQNQVINQEQYEKAITGLTESQMNPSSESTFALLSELSAMEGIRIEQIICFLTAYTNIPFLEVSDFDPDKKALMLISLARAQRLGVFPFAFMGDEVMVALLNPYDEGWRVKISTHLGLKVHFYLTSPKSFNEAIKNAGEL